MPTSEIRTNPYFIRYICSFPLNKLANVRHIGYPIDINGREFTRHAKRYKKQAGLEFRFDRSEGNGSHGRLYVGGRCATVKRAEISRSLLHVMLQELRIEKGEFYS